jgi:hypothetical protein
MTEALKAAAWHDPEADGGRGGWLWALRGPGDKLKAHSKGNAFPTRNEAVKAAERFAATMGGTIVEPDPVYGGEADDGDPNAGADPGGHEVIGEALQPGEVERKPDMSDV